MSQDALYRWQEQVGTIWPMLGWWQRLNVAMYSLGMLRVRHHSPSRVAEGLGEVGKPESVRRRLERFLANPRLDWVACCQAWAGWVLKQQDKAHPVLVVDETKLGARLRVMVVVTSTPSPGVWSPMPPMSVISRMACAPGKRLASAT